MSFNDCLGGGKTQTRTVRFGGEERVEHMLALLGHDSATVVDDGYLCSVAIAIDRQLNTAAHFTFGRFEGVLYQREEYVLNAKLIDADERHVLLQINAQLPPAS